MSVDYVDSHHPLVFVLNQIPICKTFHYVLCILSRKPAFYRHIFPSAPPDYDTHPNLPLPQWV